MKNEIMLFWGFILLSIVNLNAQCWEFVSCGDQYVGAIENGGSLFMWGSNSSGQLGNGTYINQFSSHSQVPGNDWHTVSASKFKDNNLQIGGVHTLAIKTNGTLWAWGNNDEGQLGNGTMTGSNVPIQIGTDTDWEMVAAGSLHSIALKNNGTLWGWGNNTHGQIGNGTFNTINTVTQIGVDTTWDKISTYESHNLATKSDGTLWAWGRNNFYQLGQGNNQNQNTPTQIGGDTNWIFPAAGYQYSFSIKEDSTLWGWGNNNSGQLGNGNIAGFYPNPIQIGITAKWTNVSAGGEHTIALQDDSTLWGWGLNYFGQLGQGNNLYQISSPVQITADSSYSFIDNGHYYSMTLSSDTTLWGWGQNFGNVLATNDNTDRNIPTAISCPIITNIYTTIDEVSCNEYTSPSGNYIWTATGTYIDTISSVGGGDSLLIVNLIINMNTTGVDVQVRCNTYVWIDGNTYTNSNNLAIHTLTNVAGCDSVVTLNLTINTVPISVTQVGNLLTADELGATYQWLDCSGMTLINGATNISYNAVINGDYAVIITNNGCSDTSTCYTVSDVGIIENDFGNILLFYPNPTDGNFSIDLGGIYKTVKVIVTDLNGKLINSKTYNNSQLLDLKLDEPTGVYLLMIESENKKAVIRLVKK